MIPLPNTMTNFLSTIFNISNHWTFYFLSLIYSFRVSFFAIILCQAISSPTTPLVPNSTAKEIISVASPSILLMVLTMHVLFRPDVTMTQSGCQLFSLLYSFFLLLSSFLSLAIKYAVQESRLWRSATSPEKRCTFYLI